MHDILDRLKRERRIALILMACAVVIIAVIQLILSPENKPGEYDSADPAPVSRGPL